jgi:hypothetical protein
MNVKPVKGCWVDSFELSHFRGRRRRLFGPSDYPALRSRSTAWGISIDSLIVGPSAYVRLYRQEAKEDTALWLLPRQLVDDVITVKIDERIDSLQIRDTAPVQGEVGYELFVLLMQKSEMHG